MPLPPQNDHFREIASRYGAVRRLDTRAVRKIGKALARGRIPAAGLRLLEVGTGNGRYLQAIADELGRRGVSVAARVGADASAAMLAGLRLDASVPVAALAEALPFRTQAFDAVLSFNALHHLDLDAFIAEAARLLAPGGRLALYTRSPAQNRATIWGMHFPHFAARETRLYGPDQLRAALDKSGHFKAVRLRTTAWWQFTSLPALVRQAHARHYSTFRFYEPEEFERALATFRERLRRAYRRLWAIPVRNNHLIAFARRA